MFVRKCFTGVEGNHIDIFKQDALENGDKPVRIHFNDIVRVGFFVQKICKQTMDL